MSSVVFLARGMWEHETEEEVQQAPLNSQISREVVDGGAERQGSQMGAESLELLGHQVPEEGEEEMVLSHQPSQSSTGIFLCSVQPFNTPLVRSEILYALETHSGQDTLSAQVCD